MKPPPLQSCLYECRVMHQRLTPKRHGFSYRVFYFALDLDELDEAASRVLGFAHNRRSIYEFRDTDHLTLPGMESAGVRANLTSWLAAEGVTLPSEGRVTFLCLPRMLGYVFNPVAFYFCANADGTPLCAVVQVGNTFREIKPYLIRQPESEGFFRLVTPKHFYVSPFTGLEASFDFKLRVPCEHLEIHIDDREGDSRLLVSALTGRRKQLTTWNLLQLTLKCPLVTLKVITMIHWQALRLWIKRVPYLRKAADPHLQRGVMNPHSSLTKPPL